jgi:hypothetical protein
MTPTTVKQQIQEQIDALKKTTAKATESREAAIKYLQDTGIYTEKKVTKFEKKDNK